MVLGTRLGVVSHFLSPCAEIGGGGGEFHAIGKISDVTEEHYAYHTDISLPSATERPPLI